MEENAIELEAEISKVIEEEMAEETKVEKVETKPPLTEVTSARNHADRAAVRVNRFPLSSQTRAASRWKRLMEERHHH